ncbi:unnamed protein product [Amoebophrya sp. A120]|nr:unnamed protein product [Amoebophrya sp. A120]|eukprot:GSA120T00001935001.1
MLKLARSAATRKKKRAGSGCASDGVSAADGEKSIPAKPNYQLRPAVENGNYVEQAQVVRHCALPVTALLSACALFCPDHPTIEIQALLAALAIMVGIISAVQSSHYYGLATDSRKQGMMEEEMEEEKCCALDEEVDDDDDVDDDCRLADAEEIFNLVLVQCSRRIKTHKLLEVRIQSCRPQLCRPEIFSARLVFNSSQHFGRLCCDASGDCNLISFSSVVRIKILIQPVSV